MGRLFSPHYFLHYIGRLKTILLGVIVFCGLLDDNLGVDVFLTTCFTAVTCLDEELLLHAHAIIYTFLLYINSFLY